MALPNRLVAPSSASSTSAFVASRSTGWEESDGFELMDSTSIAVVGLPDDEGLDDFEVIADIDSEDFANLLVEDFEDEGKTLDRTGPHRFLDDLETVDLTADPQTLWKPHSPILRPVATPLRLTWLTLLSLRRGRSFSLSGPLRGTWISSVVSTGWNGQPPSMSLTLSRHHRARFGVD